MLVWQDQPSGGNYPYNKAKRDIFKPDNIYKTFYRESEKGRRNFIRDLSIAIDQLYNCPCISTWVPFNEGWGQFDSIRISKIIKKLDKTRFIDHASGWIDHGGPDFKSIHIYKRPINFKSDKLNRPIVLSEYGGYGLIIKNHIGNKGQFSYMLYNDINQLSQGIKNLIKNEVLPSIKKGLCTSVYTQLSDVEAEINGFLTYDKKF